MNRSDFTANWHTHNFRCRHADFADYARAAIDAGITSLTTDSPDACFGISCAPRTPIRLSPPRPRR